MNDGTLGSISMLQREPEKVANSWSTVQPDPDELRRSERTEPYFGAESANQDRPADFIGMTTAPNAWDHAVSSIPDRFTNLAAADDSKRFRILLATGLVLAALGLGWIGSFTWNNSSGPATIVVPPQHKLTNVEVAAKPILAGQNVNVAAKADREATASELSIRKILEGTKTEVGPSQPKMAAINHGAKPERRLVSVPETRPTTIAGWTVREVTGGTVTLKGPGGVWRARQGDTVPGVGRVNSIVAWGGRWIVATTRGLISTP
jgi:hypothetical protein